MDIIKSFFVFFDTHTSAISILSLLIGFFWIVIKFREYVRDRRFKTYHELIDWLVNEQINPDKKIKADRQIATIYELRNFPKYFDVSKRILKGLQEDWSGGNKRVLTEIELSIAYMERGWLGRIIEKLFK